MSACLRFLGYVTAAVYVVSLGVVRALMLIPVTGLASTDADVGKQPECGKGYSYFQDFMKCDASLRYCFHYDNKSCIGPPNWACADPMNRRAQSLEGQNRKGYFKRAGLGNSRCCDGRYQSPIDIPINDAHCNPWQLVPRYINDFQAVVGTLENHGLSIEFNVLADDYDNPLVLTDVPFSRAVPGSSHYVFSSIQIHRGSARRPSSEHILQGIRFDAEIHLVHLRRDFWEPSTPAYGKHPRKPSKLEMRCASQTPLGITIIAIFLSITEGVPNRELNKLLRLSNLAASQKSDKFCPFDVLCDFPPRGPEAGDFCLGGDEQFAIISVESGESRDPNENVPHLLHITEKKRAARNTVRGSGRPRLTKRGWKSLKGRCFCRRRRYYEFFLRYARKGEELQCRLLHHSRMPSRKADGSSLPSGSDEPCNQFDYKYLPCKRKNSRIKLKPGHLLPANRGYLQYFGSLTTPPCSEVVNWIVMKQPLLITVEQLTALGKLESRTEGEAAETYGNVRPPLPVNGRVVTTNTC